MCEETRGCRVNRSKTYVKAEEGIEYYERCIGCGSELEHNILMMGHAIITDHRGIPKERIMPANIVAKTHDSFGDCLDANSLRLINTSEKGLIFACELCEAVYPSDHLFRYGGTADKEPVYKNFGGS